MYSTSMFFRVAFLTCLLGLVSANPLENGFETRIVGGSNAQRGEFPHMVSIQMNYFPRNICGGAILSEIWVVTAAHCIEKDDHVNIIIKAGKYDIKSTEIHEQTVPVHGVFIHEKWNEVLDLNDIALLKLAHPLNFNAYVKSISLPVQGSEPTGRATLTGWGSTSRTGESSYSNFLQVVHLHFLDAKKCYQVFKQMDPSFHNEIFPTNVCTSAGHQRLSICNGDSGGPLIQGNKIVGIVSWGYIPCGDGSPSVYTKVSSYVDWIKKKMKNN